MLINLPAGPTDLSRTIVQHLKAKNCPNGNPQRLWVAYSALTGAMLCVRDEGYAGRPDWADERKNPQAVEIAEIDIGRADYHAIKRDAKRLGYLQIG